MTVFCCSCEWLKSIKRSPLMELLRRDKPCPGFTIPEVTGLPPGVIFFADNLEDITPFKGYCCILARDSGILTRVIVKKSPYKQLGKEIIAFLPSKGQTGFDKEKQTLWDPFPANVSIHASLFLVTLLLYPGNGHNIFVCCFFTYVGVIFEEWPWSQKIISLNPLQMLPSLKVSRLDINSIHMWWWWYGHRGLWNNKVSWFMFNKTLYTTVMCVKW